MQPSSRGQRHKDDARHGDGAQEDRSVRALGRPDRYSLLDITHELYSGTSRMAIQGRSEGFHGAFERGHQRP